MYSPYSYTLKEGINECRIDCLFITSKNWTKPPFPAKEHVHMHAYKHAWKYNKDYEHSKQITTITNKTKKISKLVDTVMFAT